MRTYGTTEPGVWIEVATDENGENGYVYLTTLIQTLLLNVGENPLFANYGLPAEQAVHTQVAPDTAIARTQAQFAQYFQNLIVSRVAGAKNPTYNISAVLFSGTTYQAVIAT